MVSEMGQDNQRSVSLKAASFTAPIVVNQGNRIRVLSSQALLHLTIEECIVFSFLESVSMLIPAQSPPRPSRGPKPHSNIENNQAKIENIAVERVFQHRQKTAENRLTVMLRDSPCQILHCRIKNLVVAKKIVPVPSGSDMTTAIYYYQLEVEYHDTAGRIKQDYFDSGVRYQQVPLEPPATNFNVAINCVCSIG